MMTLQDLASLRLHTQQLAAPTLETPGEVVHRLGAVQAQDYRGMLWALGLRNPGSTEGEIERALIDRSIVRTWPMRGTLHVVPADDVRWMLGLLTPRIVARSRGRYRQLELDEAVFARSRDVLTRALEGGRRLTRTAVYETLEAAGIAPDGQRGIHILGHLAQTGVLCYGAPEGKQQTFVLLDEWIPSSRTLEGEAALAEVARRYVTGHGPATLDDLVWWSGLTKTDARTALNLASSDLVKETVDGTDYWRSPSAPAPASDGDTHPVAYLLPMYDEYTVGYKDRRAALDPAYAEVAGNGIFRPVIVLKGRVVGTWKRTLKKKDAVAVSTHLFEALSPAGTRALAAAVDRYGAFLGRSVV